MKIANRLGILALGLSISLAANCVTTATAPQTQSFAHLKNQLVFLSATIKSADDLQSHLQSSPTNSPLKLLTPQAKQRFVDSLTFNEKGLTGYYFGDLESELTASQAYQVLSLFGAQNTTTLLRNLRIESDLDGAIMSTGGSPRASETITDFGDASFGDTDYPGYRCIDRATCMKADGMICMHSC